MLAAVATYMIVIATVSIIALYATVAAKQVYINSTHTLVSAKNSQGPVALAWCFFAAGVGSWTLFSFPEIGVLAGSWGVIGYMLSGCTAILVLAVVGPAIRRQCGDGVTLTDCVFMRFGWPMQRYVAIISTFYQFLSLSSELTCVGQLIELVSPGAQPIFPILLVACVTNLYAMLGGMHASLATDVYQGFGVLSVVLIVCFVMGFSVSVPAKTWSDSKVAAFTVSGFETLITLCIAVTSSNLFYTGFWQRVYAAENDETLRKACWYTCLFIIPFTVSLSVIGMISHLAYPNDTYFFSILLNMGKTWQVLMVITIIALSTSATDSIQLGLTAEIVTNFPSISLYYARLLCAFMIVPAILIALRRYSVLNLFLIADLLCTATVGPMILSMWSRARPAAALLGCFSGLISIYIYGAVVQGSLLQGFLWFTLPQGLYSFHSMITFVISLFIPVFVTMGMSLCLEHFMPQEEDRGSFHAFSSDDRSGSIKANHFDALP